MEYIKLSDFRSRCSQVLKEVSKGKIYLITLKGDPVAELVPFNSHVERKSWKRKIKSVKIKGGPISETIIQEREEK